MQPGRHIQLLPEAVANKIAAGEVVERPAAVLKELIENALDAGATRVDIELAAGGRKAIAVSDNGCGMNRDDALLCVERHATSKIRTADDLEQVATLGFRGEALAAIAAVSQFTLRTRTPDAETGTEVRISGGKLQDVQEAGCPAGTTVEVRHLFFNVPARRKFLRAEQTELVHCRQAFLVYAMSHPAAGFSLAVDGREAQRLPPAESVEDRLKDLFGTERLRAMRRIACEKAGIRIAGLAGLPESSRGDRSEQHVFINGRPATAPVLSHAIGEAYHTLLPLGRYPSLFVYLRMDPVSVDVNVHPAKKEVRFRRPSEVRDVLIEALQGALAAGAQEGDLRRLAAGASVPEPRQPILAIEGMPEARPFSYPRLPMVPVSGDAPAAVSAAGGQKTGRAQGAPWSWCRILGQVGGLYVVLETEDGMVLMDPHAAHERVLYERYLLEILEKRVNSQGLLQAETVVLLPEDAENVRRNAALLKRMGFGISEFGGDTFIVDALPACLGAMSAAAFLAEAAHGLDRAGERGGTEHCAQESIAQASCKAAVKARDRLTLNEIERLVIDLARSEMPYTCPHGRPTIIYMGYGELHRKFGRA